MDNVFVELIGKPQLCPGKIITVVAENFPLLDDQARFLRATLAIPTVKQLPVEDVPKHLIQVTPAHHEVKELVAREKSWFIHEYTNPAAISCDRIKQDIGGDTNERGIVYINDVTSLELFRTRNEGKTRSRSLLRLVAEWKSLNYFVIIIHQGSTSDAGGDLLRHIRCISDAFIKTKAIRDFYFQEIWYQPMPILKTLIPAKIQTSYYTCKIGKSYWSSELLCFHERNQVSKNFDETQADVSPTANQDSSAESDDRKSLVAIENLALNEDDDDDEVIDRTTTLPYVRAQNPEQSKIFFYPDKDDDIDEDDPDNDLDI